MRVFVATGIFHPESGGPATYLLRFLPELLARGHHVTVLTFSDDLDKADYPYPVVRIPRTIYPIRQWRYFQAAARLWPGHDIAYVHSLNLPLPRMIRPRIGKIVGDSAWERAMRKGWISPEIDIDTFQTTRYRPLVELTKKLQSRDARQFDSIIVPSQHRKDMVIGWGVNSSRVHVIHNALDLTVNAPDETPDQARLRLGLAAGPLILAVCRLIPLKGLQFVLQVMALFAHYSLIIAGDGPMLPALEQQAQELGISQRIKFLGRMNHQELPLYYRAADYTILYSAGEGLSHVLLESLFMGTPVIASDMGGNPEVVRHGVNGLLAPYGDIEALTQTLREAFSPGMRDKLAVNASQSLRQFRWENLVKSTVEVLESFR